MSSASYSTTRGVGEWTDTTGSQVVTVGTQAPAVGDIEVRIDLTKNLTRREIKEALDRIWRFLDSGLWDTQNPL
jgi:hypothetical protein